MQQTKEQTALSLYAFKGYLVFLYQPKNLLSKNQSIDELKPTTSDLSDFTIVAEVTGPNEWLCCAP